MPRCGAWKPGDCLLLLSGLPLLNACLQPMRTTNPMQHSPR